MKMNKLKDTETLKEILKGFQKGLFWFLSRCQIVSQHEIIPENSRLIHGNSRSEPTDSCDSSNSCSPNTFRVSFRLRSNIRSIRRIRVQKDFRLRFRLRHRYSNL